MTAPMESIASRSRRMELLSPSLVTSVLSPQPSTKENRLVFQRITIEEWKETQVANMKNTLAQVHVYYVDTDHSLKAAWWHVSEGQWNAGLINEKGYKASSGSGISSLGYQELHGQPGDYKLKVYFKDRDNDDKLTVAYYKDHKWDKKVVK